MTWTTRYIAPSPTSWQGRGDSPDASCIFQIMKLLDLNQALPAITAPSIALLGFNCDEGIRRNLGRLGAAEGPLAIREALAKLPIHRRDITCYDAGDISCNDNNLEEAQAALGEAVFLLLEQGIIPIVLGGGHELAWGHYQGIAKKYPTENMGIINVDAHFDMRPMLPGNQGSSGTPFMQIAEAHTQANRHFDYNCIGIQKFGNLTSLFATAKQYDVQMVSAEDMHDSNTEKCMDLVNHVLYCNRIIYLSICLDAFAAAYAPGVSAPQALGISPWQIIPAIRKLAASGKVVSYDLAELSPKYDIDARTAKLAANVIAEIIHHHKLI